MTIIDRLQAHMKKEKIKLPKVAELTGIPYDRIYQWIKGKSSPKVEDTTILESFISGKSLNILQDAEAKYTPMNTQLQPGNCMETLAKAMEVILSQQKTIESLLSTHRANIA